MRLEFAGPLSAVKDWRFPFKLSKNGPENSKHIVYDGCAYSCITNSLFESELSYNSILYRYMIYNAPVVALGQSAMDVAATLVPTPRLRPRKHTEGTCTERQDRSNLDERQHIAHTRVEAGNTHK
jgi:hypothetical protein